MRPSRVLVAVLLPPLLSLSLSPAAGATPRTGEPETSAAPRATDIRVGPPRGAVILVGGGHQGSEVFGAFLGLAGGRDARIVVIPTAGPDSSYGDDFFGAQDLRAVGATNVQVLHTRDRDVANSDAFVATLRAAHAVWIEGGRQGRLIDAYKGTRTERALHELVARGGVVGGTSAGASVLASFLLRGGSADNRAVIVPGYTEGFGLLRNVAVDQHANARRRLRAISDSVLPSHPALLGLAIDEGAAVVVRGDRATVIGSGSAFVYGEGIAADRGSPWRTLRPGDGFDLSSRRVVPSGSMHGLTTALADSLFTVARGTATTRAAVLVVQEGRVVLSRVYGRVDAHSAISATTALTVPLGGLSMAIDGTLAALALRERTIAPNETLPGTMRNAIGMLHDRPSLMASRHRLGETIAKRTGISWTGYARSRILFPLGMARTDSARGAWGYASNIDDLFRLELALERGLPRTPAESLGAPAGVMDPAIGWRAGHVDGVTTFALYGDGRGRRNAWVRAPSRRLAVIVLSEEATFEARMLAEEIVRRMVRPLTVAGR